jgi:YVTN family beta-propeller protein
MPQYLNNVNVLFSRCFLSSAVLSAVLLCSIHALADYKGPVCLTPSKDGSKIYIVNYDANEIAVLNTADNKIASSFPVGKHPSAAAFSTDGKILYITAGDDKGIVQAIDVQTGKVISEVAAGHTPSALAITPDGKKLFAANRFSTDVYEYGLPDLKLVKKVKVIREPRGIAVTSDGKKVLVINSVPNDVCNIPEDENALIDVAAAVSVIDIASGQVKNIRLPNGSGSFNGICISPDGRYVYLTEILARFQMPTTQVERGWMNTNGIGIIDITKIDDPKGGFVNTVLLDDVDKGAANPYGITTSADGKQIFVAVSGTSELIVIDAVEMHKKLDAVQNSPAEGTGRTEVPNDLAFLVGIKKRITLKGQGTRPIAAIGNNAYVGTYFNDALQKVVFTAGNPVITEIPIGPKPEWTAARRGEIYWSDASLCFQQWQSCASCHPDARMDGYNWDLLNDGMGNPKNAKSLLWCDKTPPAMWEGVRASSAVCTRTGFQFILFTPADENVCKDIGEYLHSLNPVPSPYLVNGKLSEKAERGKKVFETPKVGCVECHPAPLFTDLKLHDVNTKCYYDSKASFDTPTLVEVWRTAPYLHDGRYVNMKEVFTKGKHGDVNGGTEGLTNEQIDDLVEYILSL